MKKTVFLSLIICCIKGISVEASKPRPEHPRPQFERAEWINLNGEWNFAFELAPDNPHPWNPEDPYLYSLEFVLEGGAGSTSIMIPFSCVSSLTRGYYPGGTLTAPGDAALRKDIELSMAAGFNGARLTDVQQ